MSSHDSTIKDLELSATTRIDDLSNTLNILKADVKVLQAKCEDLEGRSRRKNIRLVGVPEGPRLRDFIAHLIQDPLGLDEKPLLETQVGGPIQAFCHQSSLFSYQGTDPMQGGKRCPSTTPRKETVHLP